MVGFVTWPPLNKIGSQVINKIGSQVIIKANHTCENGKISLYVKQIIIKVLISWPSFLDIKYFGCL